MLLFADILVLSMSLNMRKADSQEANSKKNSLYYTPYAKTSFT